MSAIPESCWTGPSCRKSASRRRSSCSAAIRESRTSWSVNHRLAQGDRDRLGAGVGLQLREDVPDVALDRLLRDEEPLGDIAVREAVGQQLQDLALARR